MIWIMFFAGMFVGFNIGVIIFSLCVAAGNADDRMEERDDA